MKNIVFIILSLIVLTGCSKATNEDTHKDFANTLTTYSWQLESSSNPEYDNDVEKSIVYTYLPNGELWFNKDNTSVKAGNWQMHNDMLYEFWGKGAKKIEYRVTKITTSYYTCTEISSNHTYRYKSIPLSNKQSNE